MKYKAIFLDLDGTTVLPFAAKPTPRVVEAVKKVHNLVHVCLATGRLIYQCQSVIQVLNLSGPCIVANGIQIYDPETKNIVREIGLNSRDIPKIAEVFEKHEVEIHAFNGLDDIPYKKNTDAKILSFFNGSVAEATVNSISQDLELLPDIVVHKLVTQEKGHWGIEVCHATATKQHGIFEVAKMLTIQTHEIIGVGDGYNDFPLLMACGLKVAMGNAVPEVKAIADFIAPNVEDDGVAVVIEKFVLGI